MKILGFLGAVFAFVAQMGLAAIAQADDQATQIAALMTVSIDCHASPASEAGHRTPHRHHTANPVLSSFRLAPTFANIEQSPAAAAPIPLVTARTVDGMPPPARGPPSAARIHNPRAPPLPA